jgi:photosystem II stability/assembly factor-like uncharacterized protein
VSKESPQQVVEHLKQDTSDLQKRGIIVFAFGAAADGVDLTVAVADEKTVQYLYDRYGRVYIKGWLQPLGRETPIPSPTPTIALPTTAEISAPSRFVVWALIASSALFRSTDQGTSWERRSMPSLAGGGRPPEFSFVDGQNGWFSTGGVPETQCNGAGAAVWRTTDGAATWQLVASAPTGPSQRTDSGIAYAQCKEGLSFINSTHGFLGAWDPNHRPTVYGTTDAGKSWSASTLPDPPGFVSGTGGSMLRLRLVKGFGSTLLALADANRPPGYVFRSTDGGVTWAYLATLNSGSDPVFVTASRWLVIGNDGSGLETTDAGKSWHSFSTDYADAAGVASTFVFADGSVGYGTVRGVVQRTVDGGLHWTRIATPGALVPTPATSPTPSQVGLLPVTDPGFTCRLPVGTGSFGGDSSGGFVTIPRGSFRPDPAASMVKWVRWAETTVQPVLRGNNGVVAYDASFARWLPTSTHAVSSDGTQYAWVEGPWPGKVVHVTNVADGSDRSFAAAPPNDPDLKNAGPVSPGPIGVTKDSVFLTYGYEGAYGVWRLDLASGSLIKVTGLPSPNYGAGAIWVTPTRGPNHVGMYSDGDTLARLDLASGAAVDWFHRDNFAVGYLGVDGAGNPWVEAISRPTSNWIVEIWRVRGPGQADLILSGQRANRVITDSHGTWFGNETGVYLYADGRMQRVSSASVGEVVGPCI